jgi:hypothetical protein
VARDDDGMFDNPDAGLAAFRLRTFTEAIRVRA